MSDRNSRLPMLASSRFAHVRRVLDSQLGAIVARLLPGEYYATGANEYITTTLGSCVSACLWDPQAQYGGMNHFLLPRREDSNASAASARHNPASYGTDAMAYLINAIVQAGGRRQHMRAKIVGGGQALPIATPIGARNIEFARAYLQQEGIRIVGEDVGGTCSRLVRFHPLSGTATVKTLTATESHMLIEHERRSLHTLERQPRARRLELS